jgi:hypothetical protein
MSKLVTLLAFLNAVMIAAKPQQQFMVEHLFAFSGEPIQLQWDAFSEALVISFRSEGATKHLLVDPHNSKVSELLFNDKPNYIAPHPLVEAWAGAAANEKPWTSGNYRFLSRFSQRNIYLKEPSFNTAGNLLAFSAYTPYNSQWRLMTYDLKYDNLNSMDGLPVDASFPAWSPKGSFICMIVPTAQPSRKQAAVVRWDATGIRFLASDSMSIEYAAWPGSEQYLLLTAKGRTGWFIVKELIGSTRLEVMHFEPTELRFASWIPTTGKVAFLKRKGDDWELCLLEPLN